MCTRLPQMQEGQIQGQRDSCTQHYPCMRRETVSIIWAHHTQLTTRPPRHCTMHHAPCTKIHYHCRKVFFLFYIYGELNNGNKNPLQVDRTNEYVELLLRIPIDRVYPKKAKGIPRDQHNTPWITTQDHITWSF